MHTNTKTLTNTKRKKTMNDESEDEYYDTHGHPVCAVGGFSSGDRWGAGGP